MTIRRIVSGGAQPDAPLLAVERGLRSLGVPERDAAELAATALEM
jgi:hypothetical protein